jgi:hypothetical protein
MRDGLDAEPAFMWLAWLLPKRLPVPVPGLESLPSAAAAVVVDPRVDGLDEPRTDASERAVPEWGRGMMGRGGALRDDDDEDDEAGIKAADSWRWVSLGLIPEPTPAPAPIPMLERELANIPLMLPPPAFSIPLFGDDSSETEFLSGGGDDRPLEAVFPTMKLDRCDVSPLESGCDRCEARRGREGTRLSLPLPARDPSEDWAESSGVMLLREDMRSMEASPRVRKPSVTRPCAEEIEEAFISEKTC